MAISIGGVSSSYNTTPNNFYDVPTNPRIYTAAYNFSAEDKLFTIIYEDGSISNDTMERPISSGNIHTEYSNLHNTDGFSIRCFDSHTNTGLDLSSINLANNEYYVLINSDNMHLYHFAKITKVVSADAQGDKFEFSPRLGNEVAKDVKFKVFKGPSNTDKIVAISAGIDQQIGDTINNVVSMFNIARPFFYFYNDKLDKKNELNHNTKYMLRMGDTNSNVNSITINTHNFAFTTVADHRYKIIDYSKFTYNIKLEDKLKLLDDPDAGTSNESSLLNSTYTTTTDYNNCFINARRDVNDDPSSLDLTGPKRYVYYNFSPEDNNRIPIVYECNIADSFDAKAGYASLKLVDSTKNLSNKIFNNDRLMVNQKLSEEDLNDWVEVGTINTLVNAGTRTYSLEGTVERPNLYFSATNEIKIGDRICIVSGIASTHDVSLETHSRLETESVFTSATSLTSFSNGTKVYRKRLNPVDNTFMTATNISGNKLEKLNAVIISNQYKNFYCHMGSFISNADEDYGLLTLTFENNLMDNETALRYVFGEVLLNHQIFFGKVESITKILENQQSIFEVQGRNTLSKLVDIIINKDTLFSADFITTGFSPYNDYSLVGMATWGNQGATNITFTSGVTLSEGDHLWSDKGYLGQVLASGSNATAYNFVNTPSSENGPLNSEKEVYKETNKHYIFGKAMAANPYTNSVTSLSGASDKGLFFNDGVKLSGTRINNLTESTPLVGSAVDTNIKAQGFNISKAENLLNDLPFQATIDGFTDEVINTLIDFTVIEVSKDKTLTTVKLAPYMPLTLGRETINHLNFEPPSMTFIGYFGSYVETDATNGNRHILLTTDGTYGFASNMKYLQNLPIGEALFSNNQFIGRYTGYQVKQVSATNNVGNVADSIRIFVDRPVSLTGGDAIEVSLNNENKNIPLHLVNGAHLHLNKMIGMIGQRANSSSVKKYNFELDYVLNSETISNTTYTTPKDNITKYHDRFHRIFNLEKGQIGDKKYNLVNVLEDTIGGNTTPLKGTNKPFYGFSSIFSYYADTYSSNRGFLLNVKETNSQPSVVWNRQLPIGQRGVRPITYSNFVDKKVVPPTSKSLIGTIKQTCTTTNGNPDVDVEDSTDLVVGMTVGGVGVPSGTTIQSKNGNNTTEITLSANATGSATIPLVFIPEIKITIKDPTYQVLLPNTPNNIYAHKPKAGSGIESVFNPLLVRDKLYQIDNKAARLFLYGNRDIEFYTSRRTDSLLNSATRTLSLYGLFSIDSPIQSSHSVNKNDTYGNTVSSIHTDTSYKHSNIINSNKTLSNLKRFSLMRLTECVYDSFFNPINPEFDVSEDSSVEASPINSIKVHETPETLTALPAIGSNDIILSSPPAVGFGVNDFIYDRLTNKIVGRVTAVNGATITCGDGLFYTRANNQSSGTYTANQHYTSTSEYLSGFAYVAGDNLSFIKNADVESPINIGGREVGSILYEYPMGANNFTDFRFKATNIHLLYGTIMTQDDRFTGNNDPLGQNNADNRITPSTWSDYYIEQSSPAADFPTGMRTIRKTTIYDNQSILLPYAFFGVNNNHPTNASGSPAPTNAAASDPEGFWRVETVDASSNNTIEHWNYYGDYLYNQQGGVVTRLYRDINDFDIVWFLDRLEFNQGVKTDDRLVSSIKVVNLKPIGTGSEQADINSHMVSPFCSYASLGYVFRHGNVAINTGRSIVYPILGTTTDAGFGIPTESADKEATTISGYMGIKLHLDMTNASLASATGANNNFNNEIFMTEENTFLKYVDLTGCYLVPVGKGKKYIRGDVSSSSSFSSDHELMHDDNELIYVVAHENDISSQNAIAVSSGLVYGNRCRIITDKVLANRKYKILQPNPVCFWDKTPKEIKLNTLSSAYTKNMDNENMISNPPSWSNYLNPEGDGNSSKEGVQSMYVIADLDNLGGQHDLVVRTTSALTTILNNLEGEFCLSDGDDSLVCNLRGIDQSDTLGYYLELAEIKKLNGIISVSETFELSVNGDIDEKATRAVIGTTVDICKEIEETVEELLIENDIDFDLTKEDYKLFASPDFQGTNLFNLLNYLLKLKDKKMVNIAGKIKIINYDDSDYQAKYSFDDNDIVEIQLTKSNFNYFNEVIVYGSKHKAIRKDFREIKKNGKKTLEIFEDKLGTKEDVEREAQEKLIMHTQLQDLIECKIPVSKVKCLDIGETVIIESKVADIKPRPFLLLEKIQSFDGLVQLKLGKYIKGIEDTIADLLLDTKQTKSYIRNKNFNVNENAFDFFDSMKIKEMHLLIRKRETVGSTLGMQTPLNTNTSQLGFNGGSTTYTTLKEEDL